MGADGIWGQMRLGGRKRWRQISNFIDARVAVRDSGPFDVCVALIIDVANLEWLFFLLFFVVCSCCVDAW